MQENKTNKNFILNLILSTLEDFGYEDTKTILQKELKKKNKENDLNIETKIEEEEKINWIKKSLKKGHFLEVENFIFRNSNEIEQNDKEKKNLNFSNLLIEFDNHFLISLITLYLIRIIKFFEILIDSIEINTFSYQFLINYVRENLLNLLDKISFNFFYMKKDKFNLNLEDTDVKNELFKKNENNESNYIMNNLNFFDLVRNLSNIFQIDCNKLLDTKNEAKSIIKIVTDFFSVKLDKNKFEIIYTSHYIFNKTEPSLFYNNPKKQLRLILVNIFLSNIFRMNNNKKNHNNYSISKNLIFDLIDTYIFYNNRQNPYFLPSRFNSYDENNYDYFFHHKHNKINLKQEKSFKLLYILKNHNDEVWTAKFSPLGNYLVTGSVNGKLIFYDVKNNLQLIKIIDLDEYNQENQDFPVLKKASDKSKAIIYCSWDFNENYLLCLSLDTVVRIWNIAEIHKKNSKLTTNNNITFDINFQLHCCFMLGQGIKIWCSEFLKNKNGSTKKLHFIIGSPDKILKIFDIDGVEKFDFLDNNVTEFPNEKTTDDLMSLNINNEKKNYNCPTHSISIENNKILNADYIVNKHSLSNFKKKQTFNCFTRVNDLSILFDKILITACDNKEINFFKIPDLSDNIQKSSNERLITKKITSIKFKNNITSCTLSFDGKYLLIGLDSEELQVWDLSCFEKERKKVDNDGNPNFECNEKIFLYRKFISHTQGNYIIRPSFGYLVKKTLKEEFILNGSDNGYVYIWRLHTGQLVTKIKAHDGLCNTVDWNINGDIIITDGKNFDLGRLWCSVGDDKLVKIWGCS